MVGRGIEVPSAINWRGRALAVGWSNLPINCQIKHLVQNKAHTKLLDCLLIYTLIPALRKATKEGSAWDICQECIKKEEEEKCEGRWGGSRTWGRCKQAYFLSYTLQCGSDMRLINIDTCVSCKIGYQSVFFQFVMGGCHWNVQHWPRFGVLWQMFSMNANRVWIHERSKDLELGLVDYELRDIFLEGINHYDKCGFSWIEFCEAKLPCLVNSGSLDKCRIDWWSLITQRCGNSKISDDIPIICEPAILGD